MFKTRSLEIHVVKVAIYKFAAFELRFYKCSEPDILKSAICITGRTVSDNCFFEIYRIKYAIIKFVPMFSCSFANCSAESRVHNSCAFNPVYRVRMCKQRFGEIASYVFVRQIGAIYTLIT